MAEFQFAFKIAKKQVIKGDRIFLRPPKPKDYKEWSALRAESRNFLEKWEPEWKRNELSLYTFKQRLNKYADEIKRKRGLPYFIFSTKDSCLLGGLNMFNIRLGAAQSCTMGYWMGERFAGKGIMREAIEAVLPTVFEKLGLHRIEAACLPSNCRSIKLLNSLNFRKEGYAVGYLNINGNWEDHFLYALNIEDWKSMSK